MNTKISLSRTQLAFFRRFIGLPAPYLQSNHKLNALSACESKGLIGSRMSTATEAPYFLTPAGEAYAAELRREG